MSTGQSGPVPVTNLVYLYPGKVVAESVQEVVDGRNPARDARNAPEDTYGFYYYDSFVSTVMTDSQPVRLESSPLNISGTYYIDAEVLDYDAVSKLPGDHSTLLMSCKDGRQVVRCRTAGFWRIWVEGDSLVSSS